MLDPKSKVMTAECPECNTIIRFYEAPKLGINVICEECSELLEVRSLSPLELDWAYDDDDLDYEDDWEEFDDLDDDDDWGDDDWGDDE